MWLKRGLQLHLLVGKKKRDVGEGGAKVGQGHQTAGPHLRQQAPALRVIVFLRKDVAEAGKDSEAIPGEWKTRGISHSHSQEGPLHPAQCPVGPTWQLPPRPPGAGGWGWTAGPTRRRTPRRSSGAAGTPVRAREGGQCCGTPCLHQGPQPGNPLSPLPRESTSPRVGPSEWGGGAARSPPQALPQSRWPPGQS